MAAPKGRLVFIPEDSIWYEDVDSMAADGDWYCLDDLNDLMMLKDTLDMEFDAGELDELAREIDTQDALAEMQTSHHQNLHRARKGKLLWGIGGFLLGGFFSGGD